MSLYLAAANNGTVVPMFRERDIPELMPGSIDDVQYTCDPYETRPFFTTFLRSIQTYARAQIENSYQTVKGAFYNMFKPVIPVKSFETPVAIFHFEGLNEEQKQQLRSYGLREEIGGKNSFIGSPDSTHLSSIFALGPVDRRVVPGHVSADGYLAYTYCLRAFQIYATLSKRILVGTPNYLYQQSDIDITSSIAEGSTEYNVFGMGEAKDGTSWKRNFPDGNFMALYNEVYPVVTGWNNTKKIDEGFVSVNDIGKIEGYGAGIFFPYFTGMLNPDKSLIIHLFTAYFFRGLESSFERATAVWARVRPGIKNFAFTTAGRAMSHLFAGVQMSMETGSIIHCLFNRGLYVGFVLQRPDLRIKLYATTVTAVPWALLKDKIGQVNIHQETLDELVSLINGLVVDGKQKYTVTRDMVDTSRELMEVLLSIDVLDRTEDFIESLCRIEEKLTFGETFAPISEQSIQDMISYIHTGEASILRKYPAYLAGRYLLHTDRVHVALGIFGPRAPSLNYGGTKGRNFQIPADETAEDQNLKEVNGKRFLQYLPFSVEPVRAAATQWISLFNTGKFSIPHARKGKEEFTNGQSVVVRIGQAAAFQQAYSKIKDRSITVRAGLRGNKRKNREDLGEGSNKKKKTENIFESI